MTTKRSDLPRAIEMPIQDQFRSATRLRGVVALIMCATLLGLWGSRAEVNSHPKEKISFSAAHCQGSIAKTEWTLPDGHPPTPACLVEKDVRKGVLDFDADEVQGAIVPFTLPGQFKGSLNVKITWEAASAIGSVGWCIDLVTGTDLKRAVAVPLKRSVHSCASTEARKSPPHLDTALLIHVTETVSGENDDLLHVRVSRDANSSVVLDDMPGNARLIGVVIETQQAPRQAL